MRRDIAAEYKRAYLRWIEFVNLPAKSRRDEECWWWTGSERGGRKKGEGYGQFWFLSQNYYAHRFSYEYFKGEIPENHEVDHICKNRKCVNPAHLRLLPRRSNRRRVAHRKEVKWHGGGKGGGGSVRDDGV